MTPKTKTRSERIRAASHEVDIQCAELIAQGSQTVPRSAGTLAHPVEVALDAKPFDP
jgi:hypothetical protein